MNSDQRKVESYRGFEIVAKGCKGKAWAKETGLKDLTAEGVNSSEVIKQLRKEIDVALQPRSVALRKTLPKRHREYLIGLSKPDEGLRAASLINPRRVNVCYQCGEPVDNGVDLECVACGWIVCHSCAACGCGHESRFPSFPMGHGGEVNVGS
jgi:hypothetical protein